MTTNQHKSGNKRVDKQAIEKPFSLCDVMEYTENEIRSCLKPFFIGRMFLREPSWKYSANLVAS